MPLSLQESAQQGNNPKILTKACRLAILAQTNQNHTCSRRKKTSSPFEKINIVAECQLRQNKSK